jgi:23S rRNA pseudouridine1911/1915/1917 synthase
LSRISEQEQLFRFELEERHLGVRLDRTVTELLAQELEGVTRSQVERLFEEGRILLEGVAAPPAKSFKPERLTAIEVCWSAKQAAVAADSSVQISIVFEDEAILVVDKPPGLTMHPGLGGESETLAHGLVAHLGESILQVGHPLRPGIVHRLDRDTSGLLVVAKTKAAYTHLTAQFLPPRSIHRTYLALTRRPPRGKVLPKAGEINAAVERDTANRQRMRTGSAKEALTRYRVVEELKEALLLELVLETGRTHQIRVHLESIGVPVLGDPLYRRGAVAALPPGVTLSRQALHATRLEFLHPLRGEMVEFRSPLPEDLTVALEALRDAGKN